MAKIQGKCCCQDNKKASLTQFTGPDPALCSELKKIVEALCQPGKGLLAADESPNSLTARFKQLGVENSEENRRDYRQMLFSTDGASEYISGVILHDETVYQKTTNEMSMVELLRQKHLIPGVKVDKGLIKLFATNNEQTTEGLDGLLDRCLQYKKEGCHFAKWRCVYSISDCLPTKLAIDINAHVLARYATICQSARIVPIVEPEVLSDGTHSIERCQEVHEQLLTTLFNVLVEHHVYLEGMILKPAMILAGTATPDANKDPEIIADHTVKALIRAVPPAVPMISFLSGGQTDKDSVLNLNAIIKYDFKNPWTLTFCYGRALQNAAMSTWKGDPNKVCDAQAVLLNRAKLCSQAALGCINPSDLKE